MPYENEHAARLKDPKMKRIRVRRTSGSGDGFVQGVKIPKSIDIIWYIIKKDNKEIPIAQSLRFPVKNWTEKEARKWLKDNEIKYILFEPAESESKTINNEIEMRSFNAEIRADDSEKPKIKGQAAVFDVLSEDLGWFKEIIHQGSFGEIINTDDVFALINHDPNLVLGRNKSGTLFLEENDKGLNFIIDPPSTTFANDLLITMERKDMDKCSFAFIVSDERWEKVNGENIRHITKFKSLWDISIVTYPAFYQTSGQIFGKNIKTPQQVYTEYCSRTMENNKLMQQDLIKKEYNKRNKTIKLLEKL